MAGNKSKGSRKVGKKIKKAVNVAYKTGKKWLINKVKKIVKHLKRLTGDKQALRNLELAKKGESGEKAVFPVKEKKTPNIRRKY